MLANVLVVLQHVQQQEMFVNKAMQQQLIMPVGHALRMLTVK
jgi:hypothetical protein